MDEPDRRLANLARGKGRTSRPRVYIGCLPCAQGRWVADLEHAHRWVEAHWRRCNHLPYRGSDAPRTTETGRGAES